MTTEDLLWESYSKTNNKNDLIIHYLPLVEKTARRVAKSLPQHLDLDDLISDGTFGLIDAIEKYDSTYGYRFETYAIFRIRGEILDKIRTSDWAPRSLRSRSREIATAREELSTELERDPTAKEIAAVLGWELSDVDDVLGQQSYSVITNLDEAVNMDGSSFKLSDIIPDDTQKEFEFDFHSIRRSLSSEIEELTDNEKAILYLYYIEGISLKKIGDLISLTESRVCQIHTGALSSLWEKCFTDTP